LVEISSDDDDNDYEEDDNGDEQEILLSSPPAELGDGDVDDHGGGGLDPLATVNGVHWGLRALHYIIVAGRAHEELGIEEDEEDEDDAGVGGSGA
jgi:hypothetical protein